MDMDSFLNKFTEERLDREKKLSQGYDYKLGF
jgi:hypothetical protein